LPILKRDLDPVAAGKEIPPLPDSFPAGPGSGGQRIERGKANFNMHTKRSPWTQQACGMEPAWYKFRPAEVGSTPSITDYIV